MTFMMTSRKPVVGSGDGNGRVRGDCKFKIKLYHSVFSPSHKLLSLHKSHT